MPRPVGDRLFLPVVLLVGVELQGVEVGEYALQELLPAVHEQTVSDHRG